MPGRATGRPRKGLPSVAGLVVACGISAVVLLAQSASGNVTSASSPQVTQISSDPYSNSAAAHRTEVEPDIESHGSTLVAAFQTGRMNGASTIGSTNIGWATSTNGGGSWTYGFIPSFTVASAPPGTFSGATDPTVTYDEAHGTWLISAIGTRSGAGSSLIVSRSADGLTWGAPVIVSSVSSPDKDWVACDNGPSSPRRGTCYEIWSSASGSVLTASTSTDGGLTWSTPVNTAVQATGYDVQPVVLPDGTVVVVADQGTSLVSYRSTDGGATWTAPVKFATMSLHSVAGGLRAKLKVSVGADGAGKIFAVWADCRFHTGCSANDMVMSTSTDGVTWLAVTRIPLEDTSSTVDHFLAGLGVDRGTSGANARVGLVYYSYPASACGGTGQPACSLNVQYTESEDAGSNWSEPQTLNSTPMSPSWLVNAGNGRMVGDYFRTAFSNGNAVAVFVLAHAPSGTTLDEAAYVAVSAPAVLQAPANQSLPAVSGVAKERSKLTAAPGAWGGTRPLAYAYQWRRCDSSGANCVDIAGAQSATYVLAGADIGSTMRVSVTATNVAGSAGAEAAQTQVVVAAPPLNTVKPSLTGAANEGFTLTAKNGTWSSSLLVTYTYQWQLCDSAGKNCADIAGATAQTFDLTVTDLGTRVLVVVTATNSAGSSSASSAASAVITVRPPSMTAPTSTISKPSFSVGWSVSSNGWLASYDVRYRSAPYTAPLGTIYTSWQSATTATSATFAGSVGNSYCFSGASRDTAGNVSAWSAEKCTAVPLDDTALAPSGSWTTVSASNLYFGSALHSTTTGDTLTLGGISARRLALVATMCATCGSIDVSWNGTVIKQLSLVSSTTRTQQYLTITTFSTAQTGTLTVTVTSSGKSVDVDGLAVGAF